MVSQYRPLVSTENALEKQANVRQQSSRNYWVISLALASIANLCILLLTVQVWHNTRELALTASNTLTSCSETDAPHTSPEGFARVEDLPTAYIPFHWKTPWGAPNATWADTLWDGMNTAHGHIAVDHKWAADNNWTASMDVPGQPGKGMYLLQAYHQLHCLRITRSTMLSLHRQTPLAYPIHHALHCFDALRQHIMCHADNTPLYGIGNGMSGNGQMQQCRDWNALRDYATKNTACFRDGKPGMSFEDRFGVCDDGRDGMELYAPGDGL